MKKAVYVMFGFLFLGVAVIGAVFPILPTTPFLLVAAACFTKGSKRFQSWFVNTKLYQRHLDSFVKERAMTLASKLKVCGMASVMLFAAFVFMDNIYGRICIVCVVTFKYYYFACKIKTIKTVEQETPKVNVNKKTKEA